MRTTEKHGKLLAVKNGWLICPKCGGSKVLRIYPDTRGKKIQVYCKRCRKESIVNIEACQCHECPCQ